MRGTWRSADTLILRNRTVDTRITECSLRVNSRGAGLIDLVASNAFVLAIQAVLHMLEGEADHFTMSSNSFACIDSIIMCSSMFGNATLLGVIFFFKDQRE